jgi:sensor domain CHASE-containing protein
MLIFIKKEEKWNIKIYYYLRKVIQEEIRSVIKQELTEILQEGLKSTINDNK